MKPRSLYSGAIDAQNAITSSSRNGYRPSTDECRATRSPLATISIPASITL